MALAGMFVWEAIMFCGGPRAISTKADDGAFSRPDRWPAAP